SRNAGSRGGPARPTAAGPVDDVVVSKAERHDGSPAAAGSEPMFRRRRRPTRPHSNAGSATTTCVGDGPGRIFVSRTSAVSQRVIEELLMTSDVALDPRRRPRLTADPAA